MKEKKLLALHKRTAPEIDSSFMPGHTFKKSALKSVAFIIAKVSIRLHSVTFD